MNKEVLSWLNRTPGNSNEIKAAWKFFKRSRLRIGK